MSMDKSTQYGSINVSIEAIASVAASSAIQCYGVVDMVSKKNFFDDALFKKDNFLKGVVVKKSRSNIYEIDLYVIVAYGVRITEVVSEVQKRVKYDLERSFNTKFKAINVYVQGIKDI